MRKPDRRAADGFAGPPPPPPPLFSPAAFLFSQNEAALKCSLLNLFSLSLCFSIIPCNFSLSAGVFRCESPRSEPLHLFPPIRLAFTRAADSTKILQTKKLSGRKYVSKCDENSTYFINNASLECALRSQFAPEVFKTPTKP